LVEESALPCTGFSDAGNKIVLSCGGGHVRDDLAILENSGHDEWWGKLMIRVGTIYLNSGK